MKAAEPRGWPEPAAMLLLTALWLAATAWARPLNLPDEGRYVGVAWEMLRSGEWLIPTLNGLPYFHKPPLFYWITAGSMSIFGAGDWAARAAPILGGTVGAFALVMFTRRWVGARAAWVTLLVLLAHPLWTVGGQFANMDMLVAGCITATIVLLAHAALSLQAGLPHRRALAGAYAMAGLGVLAKGLIGAVLPALVLLLWLILLRRWRTLAALIWAPGILLFMLIAAPWFVAVQLRFDVRHSPSLPIQVKERLEVLCGQRLTLDGVLVLTAQTFRSQDRNRSAALAALVALIQKAAIPPRPRRKTRPTKASKLRRLDEKAHRGGLKRGRTTRPDQD